MCLCYPARFCFNLSACHYSKYNIGSLKIHVVVNILSFLIETTNTGPTSSAVDQGVIQRQIKMKFELPVDQAERGRRGDGERGAGERGAGKRGAGERGGTAAAAPCGGSAPAAGGGFVINVNWGGARSSVARDSECRAAQ